MPSVEARSRGALPSEPESATRAGARARPSRVPRPLLIVLALAFVCGSAWAYVSPAFLAPDEDVHFAYVQTLAERQRLPGGIEGKSVASDQLRAINASNTPTTVFFPYANPEWSGAAYERWRREQRDLPRDDGGGSNAATSYPPAYYAYETLPYLAASGGDSFTRLYAARLGSLVWLLVSTTAAWLLCGELFGRRRVPQVTAAATVGLWPVMDFISGSVNPDAMLYAVWSVIFWRAAVIAHRGLTPLRGLTFGLLLGLAMLVKVTTLVLVPPAALFVAWAAWTAWRRRGRLATAVASAGAWAVAFAVPTIGWLAATRSSGRSAYAQAEQVGASTGFDVREFASYLWQFYLPKLPFMQEIDHHYSVVSDLPVLNTWVGMSWGSFGWASVWFPEPLYLIAFVVTGALVVLALTGGVRRWRARAARPLPAGRIGLLLFLAAAAGATVAGLHWTDYRFYVEGDGPFAQGRYLFPLVALAGIVVAAALDALPRRARLPATAAWLGLLVALQVASLALVGARFYA